MDTLGDQFLGRLQQASMDTRETSMDFERSADMGMRFSTDFERLVLLRL